MEFPPVADDSVTRERSADFVLRQWGAWVRFGALRQEEERIALGRGNLRGFYLPVTFLWRLTFQKDMPGHLGPWNLCPRSPW